MREYAIELIYIANTQSLTILENPIFSLETKLVPTVSLSLPINYSYAFFRPTNYSYAEMKVLLSC
jgi:hypothetical protein